MEVYGGKKGRDRSPGIKRLGEESVLGEVTLG